MSVPKFDVVDVDMFQPEWLLRSHPSTFLPITLCLIVSQLCDSAHDDTYKENGDYLRMSFQKAPRGVGGPIMVADNRNLMAGQDKHVTTCKHANFSSADFTPSDTKTSVKRN